MKLLKNIVLCLFMAVSVAGVSTTAFAESDPGRISYKPVEAINEVLARIKTAQDAITANQSGEEVAKLIKAAKDMGKEINANDKVDRARQRASQHLSKGIGMAKEQDLPKAAEHLNEAAKAFADLKSLL